MIIGVAGGSGSGKTTFTTKLKEYFKDDVTLIFHDDYYKCLDHLDFEKRKNINYDHPDALDTDLLVKHLIELKKGNSVNMPIYDFEHHTRSKETRKVKSNKVIIVEGILVFHDEALRNLFDLKIYVDADADERVLRRLVRDVKDRGRDIDGVIDQYLNTVKPMHNLYVEPTKYMSDIIINGGLNEAAFDCVKRKIEEEL